MSATRDWTAIGIEWNAEKVSKQQGDHATDRVVITGDAQMPVVQDLDKFRAEFGDGAILGIFNGTSIRVMAQDVNRRLLTAGKDAETIKEAIYNRLKGVRNAATATVRTVTVTVTVRDLPDGTTYDGIDFVEYQQAYLAALVDAGTPVAVAQGIAKGLKPF
jgi:hypothetical protein